MKIRLTKEDPHTIGFVSDCLSHEAIDVAELQQWADHVIGLAPAFPSAEFPNWLVDLSTFDGTPVDLYKLLGSLTSSPLNKKQGKALEGIAYLRGREPADAWASRAEATKLLAAHPEVRAEFVATFPFLAASLPDE